MLKRTVRWRGGGTKTFRDGDNGLRGRGELDRAFDGVGRRCWLEERLVGDEANDEEPLALRLALGRPGRPLILAVDLVT